MAEERKTLTDNSVELLEYSTNYLLCNSSELVNILVEYLEGICDLNGEEEARANARGLVRNSNKIRAVIHTLDDNLREMQGRLEMVCFDLYLPEETKNDMAKEREEIEKIFEKMNAEIAEENKARVERHPCED